MTREDILVVDDYKYDLELLETFLEIAGDGITLSDSTGYFRIYNAVMEEITGYTKEEASNCDDFMAYLYPDPVDYAKSREGLQVVVQERVCRRAETVIRSKDGTMKTLLVTTTVMQKDATEYYLSIFHDITDHKRAEEALRESEERFRALFETSRDAIMMLDCDGFIDCNKATLELFGCSSKEEFVGKHPSQLSPPTQQNGEDSFAAALQRIEAAYTTGTQFFEWMHMRMDGSIFPAEVLLSRFDIHGKMLLQAAVRDVAERKRMEETQLNALLEADVASRAKSEFLANMSHEMTTPLTGIMGFSEVLMDELYGKLNEDQKQYVSYIHECGKHLFDLIADIFILIEADSGKMKLRLDKFFLRDVLKSSMITFSDEALSHNLQLGIELEPDADREVEADAVKLSLVMTNLLSNAVKFTPDGGSVSVRARFLGAAPVPGDGQVGQPCGVSLQDAIEISVTDTGIGINPEDMPSLFQLFKQVSSPFTKKYEGIGVGLMLAKKLVELHGGRIWVESERGKGSTFRFVIPTRQGDGQVSSGV